MVSTLKHVLLEADNFQRVQSKKLLLIRIRDKMVPACELSKQTFMNREEMLNTKRMKSEIGISFGRKPDSRKRQYLYILGGLMESEQFKPDLGYKAGQVLVGMEKEGRTNHLYGRQCNLKAT